MAVGCDGGAANFAMHYLKMAKGSTEQKNSVALFEFSDLFADIWKAVKTALSFSCSQWFSLSLSATCKQLKINDITTSCKRPSFMFRLTVFYGLKDRILHRVLW